MALRKTSSKRLFYACYYRLTPLPDASKLISRRDYLSPPDSTGKGFFRRFLQKRAIYHSPATVRIPEFFSFKGGEKLREKLEGNNIAAAGDRIRLDGLVPPVSGISINDARKIMRLSQVEKVKEKLRAISKSSISYCEFKRICVESCGNEEQGGEFAKLLDQSGSVIVLGNIVFLHPDQVAKSMERMISESIATPGDPRYKQLTEMEKLKAIIDQKAKAQVQGELQIGLGLFLIQTLGFMRLTFWELNWDVMEPICFFVTSLHFVIGYGFFLSTSTEPTFQGFFRRRFEAKQKKLLISHNFDINKYNQLVRACYPSRTALPCHEQGVLLA